VVTFKTSDARRGMGPGSTLIAAETVGRVCHGVELDPLYVDLILQRYQDATGKQGILIDTDETFETLASRRATEAAADQQQKHLSDRAPSEPPAGGNCPPLPSRTPASTKARAARREPQVDKKT